VKKSAVLKKSWAFSLLIGAVYANEPPKFDADYEARYPRTYQWNDNRTGTPHLSGRMPYWYEGKFQHPNPPCTVVWQRGTIIDDTCEKDPQKAEQYRQHAKDHLEQRDERIARLKYLNKLRDEGKIEIGLTETDLLYIFGEYSEVREEISQNKKKKRLWYDYTDGYLVVYLTDGIISSFNREKR